MAIVTSSEIDSSHWSASCSMAAAFCGVDVDGFQAGVVHVVAAADRPGAGNGPTGSTGSGVWWATMRS